MRPFAPTLVLMFASCSPSPPRATHTTASPPPPASIGNQPRPVFSAPPTAANPPAATSHDQPLATLARTPCYGPCPVYSLRVQASGAVEYEGESYVKVKGKASGQLNEAGLARLKQAFAAAKFGSLANSYEIVTQTDAPSAVVSFADGKQAKTVRHYHGDLSAPPQLSKLEDEIDAIVQVEQWIGSEQERRKSPGMYGP